MEKRFVDGVNIREAFENNLTGWVRLDPFPWEGQEYEILNISPMPVKVVRNKDGRKVSELRKKNVFMVKLRGLLVNHDRGDGHTFDGDIELSGDHKLTKVNRTRIEVNEEPEPESDPVVVEPEPKVDPKPSVEPRPKTKSPREIAEERKQARSKK